MSGARAGVTALRSLPPRSESARSPASGLLLVLPVEVVGRVFRRPTCWDYLSQEAVGREGVWELWPAELGFRIPGCSARPRGGGLGQGSPRLRRRRQRRQGLGSRRPGRRSGRRALVLRR